MLEKKPSLSLENAYYTSYTSGVKGGGAGTSVYVFIEKPTNVTVEGLYFQNKYLKLKFHGNNKYQGFVKNDKNSDFDLIDDAPIKEKKDLKSEEKIPFTLDKNEAVVQYLENDAKKYMKITLSEKENSEVPM